MSQFTPNGCVVTPALLVALIKDNGPWAKAVLGQCLGMPDEIQQSLLSGEVKWQIPNERTLIIIPVESPSPPKRGGSVTSSQSM